MASKLGVTALYVTPHSGKWGVLWPPGPPRIAATSNNIDFYWNFRVALTREKSSIFVETSRKKNWRGDAPMSCPMYLFPPPLATPLRFKCNRNFVSIHPRITSVASERRRRRGRSPPQCWNHGGESIFSPPQYLYQLGISKELIIHHLFTLSFQAYSLPFLQILLTVSFFFSSSGLTPRIPRTVIDTSEHIRFHCLVIFSTF